MSPVIMLRPKTLFWFLLPGMLFSCSILGEDGRIEDLIANRRLWQQLHPADYQFDLERSCFCIFGLYPARILVRADTVNAVLNLETGDPLIHPELNEPTLEVYPDEYTTIDGLFDVIERAIDWNAFQLDVTYNSELGYPERIVVEYSKDATDDGVVYEVLQFEIEYLH